jgi:hypothetical protein
LIASFFPFAVASGARIANQLFHVENHVFAIAEVFKNLHIILFFTELSAVIWRQAISTAQGVRPSPPLHLRPCLDRGPWFLLIFPFTTPTAAALDLQNAVHD